MKKERIDKLIVDYGFSESLKNAQALIMSGVVLVNNQRVEKPSELFSSDAIVRIKGEEKKHNFVGRGGLKLESAFKEFSYTANRICLFGCGFFNRRLYRLPLTKRSKKSICGRC
jgi:23S rRNA (cytidine1920-2'-O)/16S rRNA (cytidine1409-2'-O)-methyltransferase